VDVQLDSRRPALDGFRVERREVQMHGLCAGCRQGGPGGA
jgi:hypothetical protein